MKAITIMLAFCLLLPALVHSAGEQGDLYATLGGFNEPGGKHSGLEASLVKVFNEYTGVKVSAVLFVDEKDREIADLFTGFSISGFIHLNQPLSPYIGLGIFSGDEFGCSDRDDEREACESNSVFAVYPEFGIRLAVAGFSISPFVRRYFDTNPHKSSTNAYGLTLGLEY